MSQVTVQSFSPPTPWRYGATGVTLRVFYAQDFIDSQGNPVQGGDGDTGFYYEFACTVASSVITVPQFVIISTLDSRNPVVTCSAFLYHKGSRKDAIWTDWAIPSTSPTTIADLFTINNAKTLALPPDTYLTSQQSSALYVPQTRTITTTSPLRIDGGASADLSANRTLSVILSDSGEAITDVTKSPYLADNTGATDASAAIRSAIAAGAKRIYLPAGTYLISQAQITANSTIFNLTGEGVELFGDGQGLTKITVPASVTWHPSDSVIVQLSGTRQKVRGISFLGTNTVVSGHVIVVANAQGSYFGQIDDIEITSFGDGTGAGALLITTNQPWNVVDVSTTLGTTIASGAQTVTPASMTNIWRGRLLVIGGTTETVTVTAVTSTTFTATFANAHNSADSVTGYTNGFQGVRVTNFNIHDNPRANAIVSNSMGNTFAHGTIKRVGVTSLQHALYVQGGQSVFEDIEVSGIGGYGIHQNPTGGGVGEQSGNVYNNCRFTDTNDVIVLGDARSTEIDDISNGTNINYPAGAGLQRYTTITNCLFRHSSTTNNGGIGLFGPTIFVNNVLEDVPTFDSRSPYSRVHSNIYRRLLNSPVNGPTITPLPEVFGGGQQVSDNAPPSRQVLGASAYPEAVTNVSGGDLYLAPGIGVRKFTVLDNLSGSVTLTVNTVTNSGTGTITLVSGVDFNLGSSNSAAQLNQTAQNLALAINSGTNVYQSAGAYVVGASVYLVRNPMRVTVLDFTLSTNQAGRISVANEAQGFVQLWRPRLLDTSTTSATGGAATLNTQTGTITSEALTTAAGADYVLTLTNSLITASGAGSNVFVSVDNGTNTTEGLSVQRVTPAAGSVVIRIRNTHAANALNGTIKIRFTVF